MGIEAAKDIAAFYRKVLKERGAENKPSEMFINPLTKQTTENSIGIPVRLLNQLISRKKQKV